MGVVVMYICKRERYLLCFFGLKTSSFPKICWIIADVIWHSLWLWSTSSSSSSSSSDLNLWSLSLSMLSLLSSSLSCISFRAAATSDSVNPLLWFFLFREPRASSIPINLSLSLCVFDCFDLHFNGYIEKLWGWWGLSLYIYIWMAKSAFWGSVRTCCLSFDNMRKERKKRERGWGWRRKETARLVLWRWQESWVFNTI